MITAVITLDYDGRKVAFDATPWFEKATGAQIRALALCDFSGDYAADDVALELRDSNADIDALLNQSEAYQRANVEACGFEVYVEPKEAFDWLFASLSVDELVK